MSHRLRDTVLDWAATGASVGGVFASLGAFDLIQRAASLLGPEAQQRAASGMARGINAAARLAGTTFRVTGLEHARAGARYIIASNHQSLLDISMISQFLGDFQPRYVSKLSLAKGIPGVSYNLTRGGSALIDRKNPEQAHAELERLARRAREEGFTVAIFPEGTRSKTGAMRAFHEGGLRTLVANMPDVPVLPLTTTGGSRLFKHELSPIVRGVELGFHLHAPVMPPDPADAGAFTAFVRALEATIAAALPDDDREGRA